MRFPWHKYDEIPVSKRNTLQVFITNRCNLRCDGCFARKLFNENSDISMDEYKKAVVSGIERGAQQINILGGEPLLHPSLEEILDFNKEHRLKTTIYTNGYFLGRFSKKQFEGTKLRVSLYCKNGKVKSADALPKTDIEFEANFMVSSATSLNELLDSASVYEKKYNGNVFFISSIRELDNPEQEFFYDTALSMPVMEYKKLVHEFLDKYDGKMEIHVSKRGVFESTLDLACNKCRFANYIIGGKIVQCPYDLVNEKFQKDYQFDERYCMQNSTCLMSKVAYRPKK